MTDLANAIVGSGRAELRPDIPPEGHARVVIANGDAGDRDAIARVLRVDTALNVEAAANWDDLAALLDIAPHDVVVLAEGLSEMSGVEVKKRIEALYRDPPAAILLGPNDLRVAIKAFRCGFADYLTDDTRTAQVLRDAVQRAARSVHRRREEAQHVRYLERLARRDGLTGLPNRRSIEEQIEKLTEIKARYSHPFAIVVVRFREYDHIYDSFGHKTADHCLMAFGRRLAMASRKADSVARWDAASFVCVIDRDVSAAGVRSATERLGREMTFSVNLADIGMAISADVGWAMFPGDGQSVDELIERAIGRFEIDGEDFDWPTDAPVDQVAAPEPDGQSQPAPAQPEENDGAEWRLEEASTDLVADPMGPDNRMQNRRSDQRRRTFKRGVLVFNDGFSTVNCVIRDLSKGGARVSVDGQFIAPDKMELMMTDTDRRRPVELRWQRENQLGLMFLDQVA